MQSDSCIVGQGMLDSKVLLTRWMWLANPYTKNIEIFEDPSTTLAWRGFRVWGDSGSGKGPFAACANLGDSYHRFWGGYGYNWTHFGSRNAAGSGPCPG
jgi:hypothetical protein